MFKLRLIKSRSYTGNGIKVSADKPIIEIENKEKADTLVATGYFSIISEQANASEGRSLDKMSDKELDDYAAEIGADVSGLGKKADKLAAVRQALAKTKQSSSK